MSEREHDEGRISRKQKRSSEGASERIDKQKNGNQLFCAIRIILLFYRVCHGSRLTKGDDYFWDDFFKAYAS